jgi:hypothetical protein
MINPSGAIPSGPRSHEDAEYVGIKAEQRKQRVADRKRQMKELSKVASLENHPGWKEIKAKFEERIRLYESGENLIEGVQDIKTTDASLGAQLRVNLRVAAELRLLLSQVTQKRQALNQIQAEEDKELDSAGG